MTRQRLGIVCAILFCAACTSRAVAVDPIYVDEDSDCVTAGCTSNECNGTNWDCAYDDLQDALSDASSSFRSPLSVVTFVAGSRPVRTLSVPSNPP